MTSNEFSISNSFSAESVSAREDQGVREVIPHIGPIPIIIPQELFLDLPRNPVFPRRLSDSQSYAMNFAHVDS